MNNCPTRECDMHNIVIAFRFALDGSGDGALSSLEERVRFRIHLTHIIHDLSQKARE